MLIRAKDNKFHSNLHKTTRGFKDYSLSFKRIPDLGLVNLRIVDTPGGRV